jgi:hypothetical protein
MSNERSSKRKRKDEDEYLLDEVSKLYYSKKIDMYYDHNKQIFYDHNKNKCFEYKNDQWNDVTYLHIFHFLHVFNSCLPVYEQSDPDLYEVLSANHSDYSIENISLTRVGLDEGDPEEIYYIGKNSEFYKGSVPLVVKFGRSNKNDVIFKEIAEISSCHFEVRWDSVFFLNIFSLWDMGSANGTFMNGNVSKLKYSSLSYSLEDHRE